MKERKDIPESFRKGKRKFVRNVGDLKKELAELPDNLKLEGDFGNKVKVVVTNVNDRYLAAAFEWEE